MSKPDQRPRKYRYQGQHPGPHLLITAGVHGDEFESILAVQRLIGMFETADANVAKLKGQVTLVPFANESAFHAGTRCGADGLDLARTCPGRIDGTVTEQAAHHLSTLIRSADYYIDLHTGGTELAVYPLAGYTLHPDRDVLANQRQMAAAFNLPLIWGTSPHLDGRTLSVARDTSVPAIYCEYRGSATCDPAGIDSYVAGCLNVMGYLSMIDRTAPPSRIAHVIEDAAAGSGHMQACHPSPVTGLFEPRVRLGDHVQQAEMIGIVRELHSLAEHAIKADKTGMVTVLRTFPRVRQGETVGVVVNVN